MMESRGLDNIHTQIHTHTQGLLSSLAICYNWMCGRHHGCWINRYKKQRGMESMSYTENIACVCVDFDGRGSRSVCTCDAQRFFFFPGVSVNRSPDCSLSSAVCQVLVKIIISASLKLTFKPRSSRPTDTLINGSLYNFTKSFHSPYV